MYKHLQKNKFKQLSFQKARRLQEDLDFTVIKMKEVEEKNVFLVKEMENVRSLLSKSTRDKDCNTTQHVKYEDNFILQMILT